MYETVYIILQYILVHTEKEIQLMRNHLIKIFLATVCTPLKNDD